MEHRIQSALENALMTSTVNAFLTPEGLILGAGTTVGNGVEGWAPGAIFVDTNASAGNQLWVNEGTKTTASFSKVGAQPIALANAELITFGTTGQFTLGHDATQLEFLPTVDDTGAINFGDGTTDADVKIFLGASTDFVRFDVGNGNVAFDNAELVMGDNDEIKFGDGNDVTLAWDATQLEFLPVTDDTGAINIGDGTTDIDFKVFLGSATDFVRFDVGNGNVAFDNAELVMGDSDQVVFGDGNDIQIEWDGTKLTSGPATGMWAGAPSVIDPNPAVAYTVFDDFVAPTKGAALAGQWVETTVGSGTQVVGDVDPGGVYVMTCQATTDDACEQVTLEYAPFKLAAGKTLYYETRFKQVGDIQSELSFGLVDIAENLTAVADVLPADGVSFSHQDGSLAMALTCSKDGTDTGAVANVQTIVSNTWYTFGLLINGVTSVTPYINGVAGTAATATICDDELLAPYFLIRNGDATTTQVLHVDYVKVVQLR